MKYFTREWCLGNLSDDKVDIICQNYLKYIESIHSKIPFVLKLLSRRISLHDGFVKKIIFNEKEKEFNVQSICGDLASGYFVLDIKYINTTKLDEKYLRNLFDNKQIEMLYDEIEILTYNKYSHKIIFNNEGEIDIVFSDVKLIIANEAPASYKKANCLFEVMK